MRSSTKFCFSRLMTGN
ncbi:peptide IlvX [Enterobacter cancerogenus]